MEFGLVRFGISVCQTLAGQIYIAWTSLHLAINSQKYWIDGRRKAHLVTLKTGNNIYICLEYSVLDGVRHLGDILDSLLCDARE